MQKTSEFAPRTTSNGEVGVMTKIILARRLGAPTFDAWFSSMRVIAFDGHTLYMEVNDRRTKDWIHRWFVPDVVAAARVEFGSDVARALILWSGQAQIVGADLGKPFSGVASVQDIVDMVASHFGVPAIDITSGRRNRGSVRARHVAMYLARVGTTRSFPEIGRFIGGRDHTTVMAAVRGVERRMESDPAFACEVNGLLAKLTNKSEASA